jgi:hypothetical protein
MQFIIVQTRTIDRPYWTRKLFWVTGDQHVKKFSTSTIRRRASTETGLECHPPRRTDFTLARRRPSCYCWSWWQTVGMWDDSDSPDKHIFQVLCIGWLDRLGIRGCNLKRADKVEGSHILHSFSRDDWKLIFTVTQQRFRKITYLVGLSRQAHFSFVL